MSFPHHPGVGPLPPLQSQGSELAAQRHNHSGSSAPAHAQRPQLPQLALPSPLPKILHPCFISSVDSCAPWGLQVPSLGTLLAGCSLQPCFQIWVSLLAPLELSIIGSSGYTAGSLKLSAIRVMSHRQRGRVATSLRLGRKWQIWGFENDPSSGPPAPTHTKSRVAEGNMSMETCTGSSSGERLERRK